VTDGAPISRTRWDDQVSLPRLPDGDSGSTSDSALATETERTPPVVESSTGSIVPPRRKRGSLIWLSAEEITSGRRKRRLRAATGTGVSGLLRLFPAVLAAYRTLRSPRPGLPAHDYLMHVFERQTIEGAR
jgi:hypothetical protein